MFAALGLLAVPSAFALLDVGPRVRIGLLIVIAFELLTVAWLGLYAPFNVSIPARLLFSTTALIGQLGLLAWLAVSTGALPRPIRADFLVRRTVAERASD